MAARTASASARQPRQLCGFSENLRGPGRWSAHVINDRLQDTNLAPPPLTKRHTMKNLIFLNIAWVVIVTAAFVFGRISVRESGGEAGEPQPSGRNGRFHGLGLIEAEKCSPQQRV